MQSSTTGRPPLGYLPTLMAVVALILGLGVLITILALTGVISLPGQSSSDATSTNSPSANAPAGDITGPGENAVTLGEGLMTGASVDTGTAALSSPVIPDTVRSITGPGEGLNEGLTIAETFGVIETQRITGPGEGINASTSPGSNDASTDHSPRYAGPGEGFKN